MTGYFKDIFNGALTLCKFSNTRINCACARTGTVGFEGFSSDLNNKLRYSTSEDFLPSILSTVCILLLGLNKAKSIAKAINFHNNKHQNEMIQDQDEGKKSFCLSAPTKITFQLPAVSQMIFFLFIFHRKFQSDKKNVKTNGTIICRKMRCHV